MRTLEVPLENTRSDLVRGNMTQSSDPLRPADPRILVLQHSLEILHRFCVSRFLLRLVCSFLYFIAPGVPKTLGYPQRSRSTCAGLWWGSGLAWVFCFWLPLSWSVLAHTFSGTDQTRLYFSRDRTNLIEYFALCPIYVGLAVHFVVLFCASWKRLSDPPGLVIPKVHRLPDAPIGRGGFLVLSLSSLFTVGFIRGTLDPVVSPKVGWWVGHVAPDGSRVLNALGLYYTLLNFSLLIVCVSAALAFLSFLLLSVEFGRVLAKQPVSSGMDLAAIRGLLSDFNQAYAVLKLLAATLVLNVYTWKWDVGGGTVNFIALNAVLGVFGVFLISLPRYYLELKWFEYRNRRARASGAEESGDSDDMRGSARVRGIALAVDGMILTSFGTSIIHRFW